MKITAVKQQVKNPDRASIFIDGKYSFSLSLNELVSEKLKAGLEVSQPEYERLKRLSDDGKIKMRAMEWVMSRPRSRREFKDYMYRKKADPEQVDRLIEEFTDKGYMNEEKFASWLIEMRRRQGKSARAIRSELASKGIDREITAELLNASDDLSALKGIINKKQKLPRYKADPQKLMQYLARQGFSYDDVKKALNEQ